MEKNKINKYKTGVFVHKFNNINWKAVEGWGIGATKNVSTRYWIKTDMDMKKYEMEVEVFVSMLNVPDMSSMKVSGYVQLCKDRVLGQKKYLTQKSDFIANGREICLGKVGFILPETGVIELLIDVEYLFKTPTGSTSSSNIVKAVKNIVSWITGELCGQATIKIYP